MQYHGKNTVFLLLKHLDISFTIPSVVSDLRPCQSLPKSLNQSSLLYSTGVTDRRLRDVMWVLRVELGSIRRPASAFKCWVISPAPQITLFLKVEFRSLDLYVYLLVAGMRIPQCTCGGQKTSYRSWFSICWALGIELNLSDLAASAFDNWVNDPLGPPNIFCFYSQCPPSLWDPGSDLICSFPVCWMQV